MHIDTLLNTVGTHILKIMQKKKKKIATISPRACWFPQMFKTISKDKMVVKVAIYDNLVRFLREYSYLFLWQCGCHERWNWAGDMYKMLLFQIHPHSLFLELSSCISCQCYRVYWSLNFVPVTIIDIVNKIKIHISICLCLFIEEITYLNVDTFNENNAGPWTWAC